MSEQKQISFCIPVYDVKEYLDDCIQSIYDQQITDFEIICVDDCSTDGSLSELERLADLHKEIKIIRNEENKGLSYSRNVAVRRATGKYIWFVDPDDELVPGAAAIYYDTAEKTGVNAVLGDSIVISENGSIPHFNQGTSNYKIVEFAEVDDYFVTDSRGITNFGVWAGLFNRLFLLNNNLFFHEQISFLEDVLFHVEFGVRSKVIARIDYYGYYYRIRKTSVSHNDFRMNKLIEAVQIVLPLIMQQYSIIPRFERSIRVITTYLERVSEIALVRLPDSNYVRNSLRLMKENGFYPHNTTIHAEMLKSRGLKYKILYWALRKEVLFWVIHYLYKFMNVTSRMYRMRR